MNVRTLICLVISVIPVAAFNQTTSLKAFPLSSVRLLDGPFKQAQITDMNYMLQLDADRLLAPYLREAGLQPKAESYGNWENTGLDGHIGGHYLSALADMYASTGNARVLQRLNYMIDQLDKCQQNAGNGYVGGIPGGQAMWKQVAAGKIDANSFSLNGKWVPLYNIHKLFAGLVDAYTVAGNQKAKDILIKLAAWFKGVTDNLSDEQIQTMLRSEQGGINEAFADVAAITGDTSYLKLAKRLSHRALLDPLLKHKDALTGMHANTQIPKVVGFMRVSELNGDTAWAGAAKFFWQTVTENRTISIGGNSVREHFNPVSDFSSMLESKEGPETCNSYNMLKLTKHLFLANPADSYIDYYERTLYNHILSSQHPDGGFVYFTPIRPEHYRVYSQPQQGFWCCVGSGLENHGKYGELIYAHNDKDVYVNMFIASALNWKDKGLTLEQHTNFPYSENTQLILKLTAPKTFAVNIRYPSWVPNGKLVAKVNGKAVAIHPDADSYFAINRQWKTGDVITLSLPMETRAEFLPDGSQWMSFVRGPIVLAAATGTSDLQGLHADGSRMGHIANGPLYPIEDAPMIVSTNKNFKNALQPVSNRPFTYTAKNIIYPDSFSNLKLVPFYTIHDARYMLYWRYATPSQLDSIKEEIRKGEAERLAVEALTVDQVAPGEQQPESDHNYKGENTESGIFADRHWRHAKGWFSYELQNKKAEAGKLRVTYSGLDRGREFDILIDGQLLATVKLSGTEGKFYDADYPLPDNLKNKETLTVKFAAHPGSIAGGVFYVRLMK